MVNLPINPVSGPAPPVNVSGWRIGKRLNRILTMIVTLKTTTIMTQCGTLQQLHGIPGQSFMDAMIDNPDHTGMINAGQGVDFSSNTIEKSLIRNPDRFEGHVPASFDVFSAVNHAHTTLAQYLGESV